MSSLETLLGKIRQVCLGKLSQFSHAGNELKSQIFLSCFGDCVDNEPKKKLFFSYEISY